MAKNSGAISVKEKIKCFLKPISPPQSEFILVSKKHEATRSITTPPPPPQDGMLVHRKVSPCISSGFPDNLLVPFYTPGGREAWWD